MDSADNGQDKVIEKIRKLLAMADDIDKRCKAFEELPIRPESSLPEHDSKLALRAYIEGATDARCPTNPDSKELEEKAKRYARRVKISGALTASSPFRSSELKKLSE